MMRATGGGVLAACVLALNVAMLQGQSPAPAVAEHVAKAKAAAGTDFTGVFTTLCRAAAPSAMPSAPTRAARTPRAPGPPPRDTWHAEPQKVFDNLYFLGQTEYSVWAVKTSAGIIVIDTIFDYSVEDEVVGGLKTLGLNPADIKYAIVSHGHGDHSGGAKFLQDHFGTKVVLSAEDWDLLDRSGGAKPRRDIVATDGMNLTLGDTTVTIYKTPGHTLGTLSTIVPVTDNGVPHVVAEWGGTAFNWTNNGGRGYIEADKPAKFWFDTYLASVRRFKTIAAQANADVLIANHTAFDGSKTKLPALMTRGANDPNPYVIGKDAVQRYLTVAEECAAAGSENALN